MSQYVIRKILDNSYEYTFLPKKFSEEEIKKFTDWVYDNCAKVLNKTFVAELNSEFVARHYLAAKMIYSASIMVSSLEYAEEKNLKITKPYLSYYALLTCCRAILFVLPTQRWSNGKLLTATHSSIANIIKDTCSKFKYDFGESIYKDILQFRDNRELFSYSFPASGLTYEFKHITTKYVKELCSLLCEICQLTSEQIEKYYAKYFSTSTIEINIDNDAIKKTFSYSTNYYSIFDQEDIYRINYIARKQPFPVSVWMTMSEGMTEDFFGAWCSNDEDENEEKYNPNINWAVIFNVP